MIRILAAALLLCIAVTAAAQEAGNEPLAPSIKQNVIVSGDLVRIGDLIENAGDASSVAVFRAPDLGTTGNVPVSRIVEVARAHGVIAVDTRGLADIAVTRASRMIGLRDFERRIADAISAQYRVGEAKDLGIAFDREIATIRAEPEREAALVVTRLSFDPRSGRFDATLDLPGSQAVRRGGIRLTGTAAETQETVVLARSVARGDVLRPSDLVVERRPKSELSGETIADIQAAAGLSARNAMRGGHALRRADLQKPNLVERNQPVMLVFEAPGITLTMRGSATESGTEGDVVHVVNQQSKRTVQGIVTGPGRITVSAMTPRVTASLNPAPYQTGVARRNLQ